MVASHVSIALLVEDTLEYIASGRQTQNVYSRLQIFPVLYIPTLFLHEVHLPGEARVLPFISALPFLDFKTMAT